MVSNSILYFNVGRRDPTYDNTFENAGGSGYYLNVCYAPYRGINGITNNPQLVDLWHVAASSPCRNAGGALGGIGTGDIEEEAWGAPPTIGCDEVVESEMTGSLSIRVAAWPEVAAGGVMPVTAHITGRATRVEWDFGDGTVGSDAGFNASHIWSNSGEYVLKATVFNMDYPSGVAASVPVHVIPIAAPSLSGAAMSNRTFSVQFLGQPGLTYEVQSTTNVALPLSWQAVQSITSTGGVVNVVHSNATEVSRFYRVQVR
jgi:hypothetical protein